MKSHPMIFQSDSVRAILAGKKTQTRRIINRLKGFGYISDFQASDTKGYDWKFRCRRGLMHDIKQSELEKCLPYSVGDRLWGKETTICAEEHGYQEPIYVASELGDAVLTSGLRPDADDHADVEPHDIKLRSSMFMPRKFCRIELEIIGIRVERVQDISEADAIAEGVEQGYGLRHVGFYQDIWEKINGKKHPWASNPPVLTFEFKRVECPL